MYVAAYVEGARQLAAPAVAAATALNTAS